MPTYTLTLSIPELSLTKVIKTIVFPDVTINVDTLTTLLFNSMSALDFEDGDVASLINLLEVV